MNLDMAALMRYRALDERAKDLEMVARCAADKEVVEDHLVEALAVRARMLQIVRGEL